MIELLKQFDKLEDDLYSEPSSLSRDKIKQFISTLLEAQRDKIITMIEKEKKAMHDVGTFKYDEIYDEIIKQLK